MCNDPQAPIVKTTCDKLYSRMRSLIQPGITARRTIKPVLHYFFRRLYTPGALRRQSWKNFSEDMSHMSLLLACPVDGMSIPSISNPDDMTCLRLDVIYHGMKVSCDDLPHCGVGDPRFCGLHSNPMYSGHPAFHASQTFAGVWHPQG